MTTNNIIAVDIEYYIDYFKNNTAKPKPLAKLFKTDSSMYIYDTGTNKVLNCKKIEYEILKNIVNGNIENITNIKEQFSEDEFEESLENIKCAIESEDILKLGENGKFFSMGDDINLYDKLDNGLEQITLELTERCNLRCGYCIYNDTYEGKRNFGKEDMTEEIAKKAIDYLDKHGSKKKEIALTFYGGEPLVKFDLIKKCIEYSKKVIKDKELTYSLTTNLVLMTPEIAKYLYSVKRCSILCSIDGPEDIHNSYRKDINGEGSFSKAIRGLKYLAEAFGDDIEGLRDRVGFSMVFTPPYSRKKLDEIQEFLDSLEWLPKEMNKTITYPSEGSIPMTKSDKENNVQGEMKIERTLTDWSKEKYLEELKNDNIENFITKGMINKLFLLVHNRPILKTSNNVYPHNACCIPGSRRIYVTTKGDFGICERIDGSPTIGNVFDGINKEKIKDEVIGGFTSESIKVCKSCWAAKLCTLCYSHCYTDGELNMNKKNSNCGITRDEILGTLMFYHKCAETNPEGLKYLNDIEVS
ncbi:radical SAM protein [Clostridium sporogenes]|uniref:radical SAM protein n=1 Tax=Clostridium sporogenes TaxID=1509 RepID=UPI0022373438|nr:radical SAM protein [Clostridium sporogenes]MCW6075612.1 radical SAM protein [Clostridium sporogenes]